MSLASRIYKLRTNAELSQEKFAEMLSVSRQAVQKWENGAAQPDLANLTAIAKKFNVSLDTLVFEDNVRLKEIANHNKLLQPEFTMMSEWELYSAQLMTEYKQSIEEGKDISRYENLFTAVHQMPRGKNKAKMADVLFDIVLNAPTVEGYPYDEPSDLEGIRRLRNAHAYQKTPIDRDVLTDKIRGAWLGRICGCLLGKTVEGIRTNELIPFLQETGNYPMHRYILSTDATEEVCAKYTYNLRSRCFADAIDCAPSDDDTNYTVLAQVLIDRHTRDYTPYGVAYTWMDYQPKHAYCTAERVAFCNFVNGYMPPNSAEYQNPYREWIGAQIRGDYFGYINPGNPELAAEMAWRDASVSHVKNGIYGEMFVAAMLACAAETDSIEDIIRGGLAQIPTTSRLYEAITNVIAAVKNGVSQADWFAGLYQRWDEHNVHDWCHTISNAEIVVASLLYGAGDYGKSICMAVETGFDTDCNGATVGSILGMRGGCATVGDVWTAPIHGKLKTTIFGVGTVTIEDVVKHTMEHIVF